MTKRRGLRRGLAAAILTAGLTVGSCAAPPSYDGAAMFFNPASAARSKTADSYSSFLVARYASLSNDPQVAARGYAFAAETAPQDATLLERAVFSALLAGKVNNAAALANTAPGEVSSQSSLARLVIAVDALRDDDAGRASAWLRSGPKAGFNGVVGNGLAAWAAYEADGAGAALKLLDQARSQDPLLDVLGVFNRGFILMAAGRDDAALAAFEQGWTSGVSLAVAADAYARLLAAQGRREDAIDLLRRFRTAAGANPGLDLLRRELEAGLPVVVRRPSAMEGAALAIYAPAAALTART
ncbi:MAG: hypothetical protein AAFQ67_03360, partial [Pseudomonadota bacterium]